MKKIVLLAVAAGALGLPGYAPATAQVPPAAGRRCSSAAVTDPTIEDGQTRTGQINGGPVVATTPWATIELTCTIQVGAADMAHAGTDACSVTSAPSLVATQPPTLCSYVRPAGQPVYLCTHLIINGVSYYWDAQSGYYSTSSGVTCDRLLSGRPCVRTYHPPYWDVDSCDAPLSKDHVDPVLCVNAMALTGTSLDAYPVTIDATGDMYVDMNGDGVFHHPEDLVYDCPPYTLAP